MNLIKPNKLKKGDTISIIAPSGKVDIEKIEKAKLYFESKGYNVKLGSNLQKESRYLAGCDSERLEDIHNAFSDNEVNAIICARGGYGGIRLVDKIDYELIKNNPKIFCGYSDSTALSAMILKNTGLITFSGPMAQSDFSEDNINKFTENSFRNVLSGKNFKLEPSDKAKIYKSGNADGILFGGNLATIASLCGQDFIPDNKFIFFTEDVNEPAYRIDKYFTQLFNIDKFRNNISAIVLGDFTDTDNTDWLDELFRELADKAGIPIYSGYPISHTDTKATIPIGAEARLLNGIITAEY